MITGPNFLNRRIKNDLIANLNFLYILHDHRRENKYFQEQVSTWFATNQVYPNKSFFILKGTEASS